MYVETQTNGPDRKQNDSIDLFEKEALCMSNCVTLNSLEIKPYSCFSDLFIFFKKLRHLKFRITNS